MPAAIRSVIRSRRWFQSGPAAEASSLAMSAGSSAGACTARCASGRSFSDVVPARSRSSVRSNRSGTNSSLRFLARRRPSGVSSSGPCPAEPSRTVLAPRRATLPHPFRTTGARDDRSSPLAPGRELPSVGPPPPRWPPVPDELPDGRPDVRDPRGPSVRSGRPCPLPVRPGPSEFPISPLAEERCERPVPPPVPLRSDPDRPGAARLSPPPAGRPDEGRWPPPDPRGRGEPEGVRGAMATTLPATAGTSGVAACADHTPLRHLPLGAPPGHEISTLMTPTTRSPSSATGLQPIRRPSPTLLVGPDANVWFTDQGTTPALGQITTTGVITEVTTGAVVPLARQADANPGPLPRRQASPPVRTATSGSPSPTLPSRPSARSCSPPDTTSRRPTEASSTSVRRGSPDRWAAAPSTSLWWEWPRTRPQAGTGRSRPTEGFTFNAPFEGSKGGSALSAPVVGIASTADGLGYWEVGSDGAVYPFGDAVQRGSMVGHSLNKPIVGIAADAATGGYWLVASDGGIFNFDAPFDGSMGGAPLNKPVIGIAADWSTGGYWEIASDGGVFSFDAPFEGSMGATPLNKPVVGIAAAPDASGYWLVAADGGVFALGSAGFSGSMGGQPLNAPVVGIGSVPSTSLRSSPQPVILVG